MSKITSLNASIRVETDTGLTSKSEIASVDMLLTEALRIALHGEKSPSEVLRFAREFIADYSEILEAERSS